MKTVDHICSSPGVKNNANMLIQYIRYFLDAVSLIRDVNP